MPDGVGMDPGQMIRTIRSVRRMSQRELAYRARRPPSTIDRIEAGRSDPRLSTFAAIIAATRHQLVVADLDGQLLACRQESEELYDRAGRHFPAHLECGPTPPYVTQGRHWWGWHNIAFPYVDQDKVPPYTYWRRPPLWFVWQEAT